jgi:hypothetical protein
MVESPTISCFLPLSKACNIYSQRYGPA